MLDDLADLLADPYESVEALALHFRRQHLASVCTDATGVLVQANGRPRSTETFEPILWRRSSWDPSTRPSSWFAARRAFGVRARPVTRSRK